jgi:hypothetical protein
LVDAVRTRQSNTVGVESFLQQYDLATHEGVLLMCVAEALLRIPDAATADRLIRDKLSRGDWHRHLGQSSSMLVNASTSGLMLTGKLTQLDAEASRDPVTWYERVVARAGEPVVRVALRQAMKLMAEQFVMGRTIDEALDRSRAAKASGYRYSDEMLGESAITADDAQTYQAAYVTAIAAIGGAHERDVAVFAQPSISVKLSALREVRNHAAARVLSNSCRACRTVRPRANATHRPDCRAPRKPSGWNYRSKSLPKPGARKSRLERPQAGRANHQKRRSPVARLARDARARGWLAPPSATGERRVLGQRNQARAGARTRRLSGLHAQDAHRRVLPRLRAPHAERSRGALPDVRDAQCAHGLGDRGVRRRAIRGAHGAGFA